MILDVDGQPRAPRKLSAGEKVLVEADRQVGISLSNAGAVQLTINDQPAVPLGASGEARTVQIGRANYGSYLASQ